MALVGLAALGLAYTVARETSLFAVGELEVTGTPPEVRREVKDALAGLTGTSLVKLDASEVERDLRDLPSVLDAHVDRSFPHALSVVIVPEQPLAVVKNGRAAWLVSRRGRVIRSIERGSRPWLPRIWSPSAGGLSPGGRVLDSETVANLTVLAGVPRDFPTRVRRARSGDDGLTLVLAPDTELRLGTAEDLAVKFTAASAVLNAMSRTERGSLAYLDVSLPQRPVGLTESQL